MFSVTKRALREVGDRNRVVGGGDRGSFGRGRGGDRGGVHERDYRDGDRSRSPRYKQREEGRDRSYGGSSQDRSYGRRENFGYRDSRNYRDDSRDVSRDASRDASRDDPRNSRDSRGEFSGSYQGRDKEDSNQRNSRDFKGEPRRERSDRTSSGYEDSLDPRGESSSGRYHEGRDKEEGYSNQRESRVEASRDRSYGTSGSSSKSEAGARAEGNTRQARPSGEAEVKQESMSYKEWKEMKKKNMKK